MKTILTIMFSLNTMTIMTKHPLSMSLMLITYTITTALMSGMIIKSFLLSFILTITMISGVLILFIYMSSMASNEKFNNTSSLTMLLLTSLCMIAFMINNLTTKYGDMYKSATSVLMSLTKLYNHPTSMITIMMIIYLMMTMIIISYNVNINEGPLRKKL